MNNIYYVYLHRRATDNKVFYVGKGKDKRAYSTFGRNEHWQKTEAKHGLIVEIAFDNLEEQEAFQVEKDTILEFKYFDHPLCNMTNGGEGLSGFKWSEEQMKNHPSKNNIGRKHTPESKAKRSKALMGHVTSEETKQKISKAHQGTVVFAFIVKTLTNKLLITHKARAEILGINPRELYKESSYKPYFSRLAIMKSADIRRGKPAWNSGKKLPESSGTLNSSADNRIFRFERLSDGLIFDGTRYELCDSFSLKLCEIGKLFYKKARKTSQGWKLIKELDGTS